ncbi:hypothetical protein [Natrinema caseinilyticum]|uniref:hypothetical protein n=1 Tax=Natrinema caseinilyticum TaxID=2961570 RepID=UPI0020C3258B|nr:hypothetical protein [Natrinema caseinilyticum]
MKYCLDCEWSAVRTDEPSRRARSRAEIDHYVATGHAIESNDSTVPPTTPDVSSEGAVPGFDIRNE